MRTIKPTGLTHFTKKKSNLNLSRLRAHVLNRFQDPPTYQSHTKIVLESNFRNVWTSRTDVSSDASSTSDRTTSMCVGPSVAPRLVSLKTSDDFSRPRDAQQKQNGTKKKKQSKENTSGKKHKIREGRATKCSSWRSRDKRETARRARSTEVSRRLVAKTYDKIAYNSTLRLRVEKV